MQQPLRGTQKLVLLCLADWANHEHRTWHTTRDVVARVGVDRSAVLTRCATSRPAASCVSARRRGRTYDEWGIDAGPGAAEDRRPENPDRRMVVDMLASTYKREAIPMVIETAIAALGERSPDELIAAGEARRVYDWAVGPAEGIMG